MPQTAATVFSLDLKISGQSVSVPFDGIKFSVSVSGFGTSGISTGQLEFDIWDEFGQYSEAILAGASARLHETNGAFLPSAEYYISKRSVNGKICHITAYDIMSKADEPFDASGFETYFERGHKTADCYMSASPNIVPDADGVILVPGGEGRSTGDVGQANALACQCLRSCLMCWSS